MAAIDTPLKWDNVANADRTYQTYLPLLFYHPQQNLLVAPAEKKKFITTTTGYH